MHTQTHTTLHPVLLIALLLASILSVPAGHLEAAGGIDPGFDAKLASGSEVTSIVVLTSGKILIAGGFSSIAGQTHQGIARLNADGSLDTSFTTQIDGNVYTMLQQPDGKILLGGDFRHVGNQARSLVARITSDGAFDSSFNAQFSESASSVYALALQSNGQILIGGDFTDIAGQDSYYLVRVSSTGVLDPSFDLQIGGRFVSMIVKQADGKIVLGGTFTSVAGQLRSNIARLNTNGTLDTSFNPGADGEVSAFAQQADGTIVLGGNFTTIAGHTQLGIARLMLSGTFDTTFMVDSDGPILAIMVRPDQSLLIGGAFTGINTSERVGLARLNPNGSLTADFDTQVYTPGSVWRVRAIAQQADGKVLIGGTFSSVAGQPREAIARLYGSDMPEIALSGLSQAIQNGDSTASITDGSSYGKVRIGQSSTHSFSISNMGSSVLKLTGTPLVRITGPHASDFEVMSQPSATIASGSSSNFQLRFKPSAVGLRSASISIANDDSDENPYTFVLQGEGTMQGFLLYLPLVRR